MSIRVKLYAKYCRGHRNVSCYCVVMEIAGTRSLFQGAAAENGSEPLQDPQSSQDYPDNRVSRN